MLIDCVYRQGDMCRAVNESINTVSETRGWGCASDNHCGWIMPGATGKDRDRLLIGFYKNFKIWKPDDVLYSSQLAGHDSFDENDYSTIEYEAGMTGKFPPTTGHFYKDIIAGHVAASHLARDLSFSGIFFDGESHYYIDGSAAKFRRVLCLAYDEKEKKYYQFDEDGKLKEINAYQNWM